MHPRVPGVKLVQWEGDKDTIWRCPATGDRFIVSPISGAVIQTGKTPFTGKKRKPGGGRKPDAFKDACEALLDHGVTHLKMAEMIHHLDPNVALRMMEFAAKYAKEKPVERTEHTENIQVFIGDTTKLGMEVEEGDFEVLDDAKALPEGDDGIVLDVD